MSDKLDWEVENLKRESRRHERRLDEHDKKLSMLQSFKDSTVEKLITIFSTIDEIKKESQWMKRTFTKTLIGAIASVIGSLLVWLITS